MASNGVNLAMGIDYTPFINDLNKAFNSFTSVTDKMQSLGEIQMRVKKESLQKAVSDYKSAVNQIQGLTGQIKWGEQSNAKINLGGLQKQNITHIKQVLSNIKSAMNSGLNVEITGGINGDLVKTLNLIEQVIEADKRMKSELNAVSKMPAQAKDAAVVEGVKQEEAYRKRINELKSKQRTLDGMNLADLKKQLEYSRQLAAVQRQAYASTNKRVYEIGANRSETRAEDVRNRIAAEQERLAKLKEQEKQEEKNNKLFDIAVSLEEKLAETGGKSLKDLRTRVRLSERLVEIYTQLQKSGAGNFANEIARVQGAVSPDDVAFTRKMDMLNEELSKAQASNAYDKQASVYSRIATANESMFRSTGEANYRQAATDANNYAEAARRAAAADKELANAKKKMAEEQGKINRLNNQYKSIESLYSNESDKIREKIKVVNQLKAAYEQYRLAAMKANDASAIAAADTQLAQLERQRADLVNLRREEQARIAATNQRNSLLNEQGKILGRLKTLAANYLDVYAIAQFGQKLIDITGYFEKQRVALQGILNSASEAQKAFEGLKAMALESPFQLKELVTFTKELSAYGIEAEKLLPTVSMLSDMSAGLGVDMSRLILAYGQVKSASVLRGQELRQFTEAGIPMVQALADKFTALNGKLVTTADVFDLISKRQVSFEMVSQVLKDMTSEGGRFYQMQANITDTLYGQVEKLKDTWTIAISDIGSEGAINKMLKGIVVGLQGVVKSAKGIIWGLMTFISMKTSGYFAALIAQSKGVYSSFITFAGKVKTAISAWIAGTRTFSSLLKSAFSSNALIVALSAIVGLIANAIAKSREWKNTLNEINTSFAKDTAKLTSGLDALIGKLSMAEKGSKKFNDLMETLKANYGEYINNATADALVAEANAVNNTANSWGRLAESIKQAIIAKKEYERKEALVETASEDIVGGIDKKGLVDTLFVKYDTYVKGQYGGTFENEQSKSLRQTAQYAIDNAMRNALAKYSLGNEQGQMYSEAEMLDILKRELEASAISYGLSREDAAEVANRVQRVFDLMKDQRGWHVFIKNATSALNTFEKRVEIAFSNAEDNIDKQMTADVNAGKAFNPADARTYRTKYAIEALDNTLRESLSSEEYERLGKAYQDAIAMPDDDLRKVGAVSQALYDAIETIPDGYTQLITNLNTLKSAFVDSGQVTGDIPSKIHNNIQVFKGFENMKLTDDEKRTLYRYMPSDSTLEEKRNAVRSRYQENKSWIDSHRKENNPIREEEIRDREREQQLLKILASKDYFDIADLEKSGGGSVTIRSELSEFINTFKDAYARYKEATQQGGVEMGLAYVRNDEQFKKMFGQFFGGAGNEQLAELNKVKIGDKGMGDLLLDKFITEGLENGVLDFEKAALSVADELEAYYHADEQHRRSSFEKAKQLRQWVNSVISKDNLNKALDKLAKEMSDLSREFSKTTQSAEVYRKLVANGTAGTLGGGLPANAVALAQTPTSELLKGNILKTLGLYNEQLSELSNGEGTPFEIDFGNWSINDLYGAISKIQEQKSLNADNFDATELGKTGEQLRSAIEQLISTLIQEKVGISGEQYTGDALKDLLANAGMRAESGLYDLTTKENVARAHGTYDYKAVQELLKQTQADATAIFDQFINDSRFDVIASENFGKIDFEEVKTKFLEMIKDLPPILKEELQNKLNDLEMKVDTMNAEAGALGAFGKAVRNYRNADADAKAEYDEEKANNADLRGQLLEAYRLGDLNAIEKLNAQLARSEEHLKEIGENGKNSALEKKKKSVADILAHLEEARENADMLSSAVTSVVDAFKSLSNAVNKVYDVMNDGENPQWMQDMDGFLGDFAENFQALIAPIGAVISMIIALTIAVVALEAAATPLLIAMAVIIAIAAVIAGIMAAFQQHDRRLEHSIEDLQTQIDDLDNAITNLNAEAERSVGFDKMIKQADAYGKSLTQATAAAEQARLEEEKKNTDEDKLKEYKQQSTEYMNTFLNGLREIRDEILSSTEDWSSSMSDAIRSAFQNGENAARAFRGTVKEMIGDVVQKMLEMAILQPMIESAMKEWTNEDALRKKYTKKVKDENGNEVDELDYEKYMEEFLKNVGDPEKVEEFIRKMEQAGNTYIDTLNGLPDVLQDAHNYNSELSSLSGGIKSITEDTARRLEALQNSQLGYVIQIAKLLEQYIVIGDNTLSNADIQANLSLIRSDTSGIRTASEAILSEIKQLRSTNIQPISVKIAQ